MSVSVINHLRMNVHDTFHILLPTGFNNLKVPSQAMLIILIDGKLRLGYYTEKIFIKKITSVTLLMYLLLVSFRAQAFPMLTGGLIQSITHDHALYKPGATAIVTVTLQNNTGSVFSGTVTASLSGRGVTIGAPAKAMVSSIAKGATQTVALSLSVPANGSYRGYLVDVSATSSSGTVDEQATALDASPDWTTYPRQCWVAGTWTSWPYHPPQIKTAPEQNMASLNAWHCNNLQFFNMQYRWHRPYTSSMVYKNGDLLTQDQRLIMRNIGAAHNLGMATLAYVPMYSVNANALTPNFLNDGSGVQLSWGMFLSNCGGSCKLSDMKGFGGDTAATANIGLMDPTNPDWIAYWNQQVKLWIQKYGFDGVFIDTWRDRRTVG